jgi:dolichyl-phosphate beta-glucosyltransferase
LSVVIPAYNEEERLPSYLDEWLELIKTQGIDAEVLVLDDGSTDGTLPWLEKKAAEEPVLSVSPNEKNMGKGPTICRGMVLAKGQQRLFCDADGATPAEEYLRLVKHFDRKKNPVVIAARLNLTGVTDVERKLIRHYTGRVFATLVSFITRLKFYDTQCGFKLFSAEAAEQIFPKVGKSRWAFDVEVLLLARNMDFHVVEVPVSWKEIPGSKISMIKTAPKMLWEIWQMARKHKR